MRPSPFARLALGQRRVERLHGQPLNYFALNLREWRQLKALVADDALTLQPALCEAVEAATVERARDQLDTFLAERPAEEEGASFKLPVAA